MDPIPIAMNAVIFLTVALSALFLGSALRWQGSHADLREPDAYVLVGIGWMACTAVGAVRCVWNGVLANPLDAFFETMSGMTTTGYSAITIPMEQVDLSIRLRPALLGVAGRGMGPG